jgi:hypothetical protein
MSRARRPYNGDTAQALSVQASEVISMHEEEKRKERKVPPIIYCPNSWKFVDSRRFGDGVGFSREAM